MPYPGLHRAGANTRKSLCSDYSVGLGTVSRRQVYFRPMYFGPMGKVAGTRNMEPWKDPASEKNDELPCEIAGTT